MEDKFAEKYKDKDFEDLTDVEKVDLLLYFWASTDENLNELLDLRNKITKGEKT